MIYPVNKEKCEGCSMCSLVTKDILGGSIPETDERYQCLAMAEADCKDVSESERKE